MCLADRVLVYGDCAVNPKPDAEQLADIAISSAETAAVFGIDPRIAMLSYSTGESGKGEDVDRVREATEAVRNELRDDAAVIVKLPPWPDHIRGLALGAQEGGATALAATNTLKVLHLPTDRNAAPLVGGLSGEALRPLALRCVWELAQDEKLTLPIFGTGGIFTLRDVQDYLRVGAQAVQVASGEWLSPGLTARLASEVMHNVKYE
jgi:dihydroorotate dehydrogenase (NAD+) catalytic subunit